MLRTVFTMLALGFSLGTKKRQLFNRHTTSLWTRRLRLAGILRRATITRENIFIIFYNCGKLLSSLNESLGFFYLWGLFIFCIPELFKSESQVCGSRSLLFLIGVSLLLYSLCFSRSVTLWVRKLLALSILLLRTISSIWLLLTPAKFSSELVFFVYHVYENNNYKHHNTYYYNLFPW